MSVVFFIRYLTEDPPGTSPPFLHTVPTTPSPVSFVYRPRTRPTVQTRHRLERRLVLREKTTQSFTGDETNRRWTYPVSTPDSCL